MKTIEEASRDVADFIQANGGDLFNWYVDVAEDAERRLADIHKVPSAGKRIQVGCSDADSARWAAWMLHAEGCSGPPNWSLFPPPPDPAAVQVYAYLKTDGVTFP